MKKKTKWQLVKILDALYSKFVRLSYSDKNWYCKCVTCGKIDHYKRMQNWHYITRANYKYRRDDDNCFVQCPICNVRLNGNYKHYTLYMIDKYGRERVEARINEVKAPYDIKPYELESMIEIMKEKVKALLTTTQ